MARTGHWNLSADVARRVSLGAQGFADSRPSSRVDRRHLRRVMDRMQVLQLDSIPVVIRTQYLPFHARLGPYRPQLVDEIAYRHDEWFEAWSHEASLLPVASEPLFRWMKARARQGSVWKGLARLAEEEPHYVASVLAEVRERGAVAGGELRDPRPASKGPDGWWDRSLGVTALDWLFRVGELGIRRRGNFEKVFSPLDTIVPADVLAAATPAEDEAIRELIVRSVRSMGVGTAEDVADHFRLPIRDVRARLPEVVESGAIVPASVQGWQKPAYADPGASIPRQIVGSTVLSPFDPVVWNRDRAVRIYDFEYRIEIYTPAAKRRYGYYVLPVLVDGRLVARLDVKTDREAGVLRIKSSHAEPGRNTAEVASRVADAIEDLAITVGVADIEVVDAGDLAPALRKEVAARG